MPRSETPTEKAEKLKQVGNDAYRKGQFAAAIESYSKAVKVAPEEPVYLSNLSAAQYEDGRYGDCKESVQSALELLKDQPDSQNLLAKLLFRRARTLLQLKDVPGAQKTLQTLLEHDPEVKPAQVLTVAVEHLLLRQEVEDEGQAGKRVSELPRYRYPRNGNREYHAVGHDAANSLLAPQYNGRANDADVARRLRITIPRSGKTSFEFSGMFAGLGDGRHLHTTIIDIGDQLKSRAAKGAVKIHLTAIDIHPAVLARDLIVLFAVDELSQYHKKDHLTNERTRNLLVMLDYVYWGTVMPPTAHNVLMSMIQTIADVLSESIKQETPVQKSWIHLDINFVPPVLEILQWWLGEGQSATPFSEMLQKKQSNPLSNILNPPDPTVGAFKKERRLALIEEDLASPENQAYIRKVAADEGISLAEAKKAVREIFLSHDEEDTDIIQNSPLGCIPEAQGFKTYPILAPPPHAFEPPELAPLFKIMRIDMDRIRESGPRDPLPPSNTIDALLEQHWRVNCTLHSPGRTARQQLDLEYDPFDQVLKVFSSAQVDGIEPKQPRSLYEYSASFFSHMADAIRLVRSGKNDSLCLELVLGDAFVIMDQIQYASLPRGHGFPKLFDRIHLTNVPDYVGGDLNTLTLARPLLKQTPLAYLTRNCLLNPSVWGSGPNGPHEVGLNKQVFSYTGLIVSQLPNVFHVKLEGRPGWLGDYSTWTIPTQRAPRLPRQELERMIYRVFLKTVLPAKWTRFTKTYHPREALNIHALFRLIISLQRNGYPAHYLQETLESMLENRLVTDIRPHTKIPISLSTRTSKQSSAPLSTAPFVAELEIAAAIWQPLLPFQICSPNLPSLNDIVRYSVQINLAMFPLDHVIAVNILTMMLVIGTPGDLDAGVGKLRGQVVGAHAAKTSIQVISLFHWDAQSHVATFLLSRKRGASLLESKLEIALVDCMFWRITSKVSTCASMQEVGDVDHWDKTIEINPPTQRDPPKMDDRGMVEDVMAENFGPGLLGPYM